MTEYVTPNIHTVLKKYQTSAPKSLQGPGHSLANIATTTANNALSASSSPTACIAAGGTIAANAAALNCPLDVTLNNGVANLSATDIHGLVAMRTSPCDLVKMPSTSSLSSSAAANVVGLSKQQSNQPLQQPVSQQASSAAATSSLLSSATNPALPLIKKEIMTSPEPATHPHDLQTEGPFGGSSLPQPPAPPPQQHQQSCGPPQPPSIKIMPPPPPEVSQPILSAADTGSGELYETRLEGKTLGCFSMGGEMRLCLPQFLNNVLAEFSLEQINRSFDDLGIFCSQCNPEQLMEFKAAKILPNDVKSSGLITRTDAERLCAVLLHRSDRNSYINVEDIPKGAISFKVYHRCFGKCDGICTPDMYSYQKPTCIMCLECKGWFSPQKFVGHVHRKVENRTCHWGFDSRNWHDYLHVALDVENREKYQKILDELKEVEMKEQQKAQQEINYLKRKAEMHLDHSILVPSMGLPPPQHQPLPPSVVKHRGGELDIPSTKKTKSLDEASAYQLEYQHYQSLMYAHCAQQQRMVAAGQMSAFRPWPQPKTFMHAAYNAAAVAALSTLPYLSQEPPVLQNPERVVRSSDRERFERTYQPNVALAPRKTHLTQEREKEQRELRERERIEREREREMERIRERERERSREREREYERERDLRERELLKKQQLQQQQQQQQIKQQQVSAMCEGEIQIKQERAPTPLEMSSPTTPPPLNSTMEEERRSSNAAPPSAMDEEVTNALISPLALARNKVLTTSSNHHPHLPQLELQTRRLSMQNSTSSNSSASSTTPTNLATTPPAQKSQHPPLPPQHLQRGVPVTHGPSATSTIAASQSYMRQSPSPNRRCNSATCTNPRSPEEFGGSNEITSSTSPLPPQQQQTQHHNAQTIIATVNQHNKLLPNAANATFGASNNNNSSNSNAVHHNETPGRIRISKNLINQNNIIRSPTPPAAIAVAATVPTHQPPPHHMHQQHGHHHQQQQQQAGPLATQTTAVQNHQQQYDYFKQNQRFYQHQQQQQQHQHHQQQHQQQQRQRHHSPQPPHNHNHNSPSQSSNANTPSGLNLTTNATATSTATSNPSNNHDNGPSCIKPPHLRMPPQASFMSHQQQQQQQFGHSHHNSSSNNHLPNGRVSMTCEFELSTDTDDESVNDGEPDSSNSLTPWELAIETTRDSRPKDRERLLNMLQRLLNENQHYRLQNQQLKELIEVRDEQHAKLQNELQHCQRQLSMLQINQQQQQQTAAATSSTLNGGVVVAAAGGGGNGLITKALRKETPPDDQLILRVPLKKSQRREPESYESRRADDATSCDMSNQHHRHQQQDHLSSGGSRENSFQHISQIKRELSESMEEDDEEDHENQSNHSAAESSQQNVESSLNENEDQGQQQRASQHGDTSESEQEDNDGDTKMSSPKTQSRSQSVESSKRSLDYNQKTSIDSEDEADEHSSNNGHVEKRQTQFEAEHNSEEEDEEDDEEEEEQEEEQDDDAEEEDEEQNTHKRVQAPHSNAINTPPTATTPLSPDSAATAGQLFDSSNSSDESSMKKAQMSASNALAKMNSETNDDDDREDDASNERRHNNAERDEEDSQQSLASTRRDNSDKHRSDHESSDGEQDEQSQPEKTCFRMMKPAPYASAANQNASNHINSNTNTHNNNNNTTTTVVLATKASKKLTPTTNNEIKIKQEYL